MRSNIRDILDNQHTKRSGKIVNISDMTLHHIYKTLGYLKYIEQTEAVVNKRKRLKEELKRRDLYEKNRKNNVRDS